LIYTTRRVYHNPSPNKGYKVIESVRWMKLHFLLLILGAGLLAAACGPAPQIRNENYLQDDSLFTEEPCAPPCWRGITPGETAWRDALTMIEDDPTLAQLEEQADEESDRIGAAWSQTDGELCCQMLTEDGETVSFIILQTTPDHTFGEVVNIYGEPTYLVGEVLSDDQGLFSLFYPDTPMLVYAFVAGEQGELTETSEVVGSAYMTEDLMELLLNTSELHAWEGFKSYSAYMDGEFEVTPSITVTPSE